LSATIEAFADALDELLAAAAIEPGRQLRCGTLELAIAVEDAAIVVALSGWSRRFAVPDDDDGADAAALALDLIAGALFGTLRVIVERWAETPRRFTLQLQRDGAWQTIETQGSRPWNPLARASTQVHVGDATRPPAYQRRAVVALPWAPWAGEAGFYGAFTAEPVGELPVDGELDLHNFRPREIKPLVLAYLDACLARGITQVRIVHGKGIGNLRRTVHALLERHPRVQGYRIAGHGGGSWGATLVDLSPKTGGETGGESGDDREP
jgi:hypothetical protein